MWHTTTVFHYLEEALLKTNLFKTISKSNINITSLNFWVLILSFILQKQWEALIRRAQCRASGQDPPRRGKKGKVWKNPENPVEIPGENPGTNPEEYPEKNLNENPEAQEKFSSDKQHKNHEKPNQKEESKVILENLKYDTLFVDTETDLKQLFSTHFDEFDATNQGNL